MGASFPIGSLRSGIRDSGSGFEERGHDAGELYAANTIGAALGAALTGFVLLPALGLFGTTLVGVALNALAAAGALLLSARSADRSAERHSHQLSLTRRPAPLRDDLRSPSHIALPADPCRLRVRRARLRSRRGRASWR